MLLFFFMVTTQMRETEQKVKVTMPVASEVAKLERKDLSANINIGSPTLQYQAMYGTDARIQLNDSFKPITGPIASLTLPVIFFVCCTTVGSGELLLPAYS